MNDNAGLVRVVTRAIGVGGEVVLTDVEWLTIVQVADLDRLHTEQERWRAETLARTATEHEARRAQANAELERLVEAAKRNASESATDYAEQRRQSAKSKLTAHLEHELYYAEEDMMTAERLANGSPTNPAYQREMRAATQRYRVLASDLKGARSR